MSAQASEALVGALTPVLQTYTRSLENAMSAQSTLKSNLEALLAALQAAQGEHKEGNTALMFEYSGRVEALRKRLESVAYTMNRVALRLENLQGVVTKVEMKQNAEDRAQRKAIEGAASQQ